jgi:hypothetical protein
VHVQIVGAGIGGLSAALALHASGIGHRFGGRAATARRGHQRTAARGARADQLGLGDELAATGIRTAKMAQSTGMATGSGIQLRSRRSVQLATVLDSPRRASDDPARRGALAAPPGCGAHQHGLRVLRTVGDRVDLRVCDQSGGADGFYSGVWAQLYPGELGPRWGGIKLWRGVTPGVPFLTSRTVAVAGANASLKFVAYPIPVSPSCAARR